MTKAILAEFRTLRLRHLKYGIGRIEDKARYNRLCEDVWEFTASLPDANQRRVIEMMYLHGKGAACTAILLNYSESQVRRIRRNVLDRLE